MIILVLLSLVVLLLIYRQASTWRALHQEIDTEQAALRQANTQLDNLKEMETKAADMQEQLNQVEMLLPTEPKEDFMVKQLQRQAYNSGMRLLQIKVNPYEMKKDYTEIPFIFALEGTYSGLQYFLQELQQGPRTVVIREMSISKETEATPMVRVDIVASAFYVSTK